jgi:zinc protease
MTKALLTAFAVIAAMNLSAQTVDRTKPPETGPLPAFKLPPVFETKLDNGLQVVLLEDRRFPLVTVRLGFQAGSKFDPAALPGVAEAAGALLTEGTKTRASRQIAEQLAEIGGALSANAGPDSLVVSGNALAEHTATLLDLLADVAQNANFPDDEVQIYKGKRTQELLAQRSQADFWADDKIAEAVFGTHPYSRTSPTPESVGKLDREILAGFRDRLLAPNNAVLILLGSLPPRKEALELIRAKLGGWERRQLPPPPEPKFPDSKRSVTLVDRPGSVQADIRVGQLAIDRLNPDYFPMVVANTVLGGGTSSRMFMNIREQKGFAYDAHSSLQPRRNAGLFTAVTQVRNEVIGEAMEAVDQELRAIAAKPVETAELTNVKNFLSGIFVLGLETQGGLASQLSNVKLMGLPNDYLELYTTRVRSVEPQQIQSVAKKYISPEDARVVVVGDASKLRTSLEKYGQVAVVKAE